MLSRCTMTIRFLICLLADGCSLIDSYASEILPTKYRSFINELLSCLLKKKSRKVVFD